MATVRSNVVRPTTLGILAVVILAAVVFRLARGGDNDEQEVAAEAAPSSTTTALITEPPATTPVSPTTTSAPQTTTTTDPPATTTTTTTVVLTGSDGYEYFPKPSGGPGAVAPGGALTKHLAADIAAAFGLEVADVDAAIAAVDLPPEAEGNPEGWLAPGKYGTDWLNAEDLIQAMVDRRVAQLEERAVPRGDWYRVLTAASVIETETYNQNEKPKVARVLTNRLAGGGALQMDSIILYPVSEDRIFTTSEERASSQPYNSYKHNGLPPTPISAPDEASLDAFLEPPPGDWWFYVTVDLDSGETRYAITYEGHKENVVLLRAWLAENPTS